MFDVGLPELIMILVVALIVFGPGKLPEIGAALGKAIREFRRATQGLSDEIRSATLAADAELRPPLRSEPPATPTEPRAAEVNTSPTDSKSHEA